MNASFVCDECNVEYRATDGVVVDDYRICRDCHKRLHAFIAWLVEPGPG